MRRRPCRHMRLDRPGIGDWVRRAFDTVPRTATWIRALRAYTWCPGSRSRSLHQQEIRHNRGSKAWCSPMLNALPSETTLISWAFIISQTPRKPGIVACPPQGNVHTKVHRTRVSASWVAAVLTTQYILVVLGQLLVGSLSDKRCDFPGHGAAHAHS